MNRGYVGHHERFAVFRSDDNGQSLAVSVLFTLGCESSQTQAMNGVFVAGRWGAGGGEHTGLAGRQLWFLHLRGHTVV